MEHVLTESLSHVLPVEVLEALETAAAHRGHRHVLFGAAARDIVLATVGSPSPRATTDVDLAIAVESTAEFSGFRDSVGSEMGEHRVRVLGVQVDVVPFGGIERAREVTFAGGERLDVTGLAEAAGRSDGLVLPSGARLPVASLSSQIVLKLLAWRDRSASTVKDSVDLRSLLAACSEGPYETLTWADERALDRMSYDLAAASTFRAGREAGVGFTAEDADRVLRIIDNRGLELLSQMGGLTSADRLMAFRAGFADGSAQRE